MVILTENLCLVLCTCKSMLKFWCLKQVYVKLLLFQAIEFMVVDALLKANDYLDVASHVLDPSEYWKV